MASPGGTAVVAGRIGRHRAGSSRIAYHVALDRPASIAQARELVCDGVPARRRSPTAEGTPALRLQRRAAARAVPRASTPRSAAIRTRCTTRSRRTRRSRIARLLRDARQRRRRQLDLGNRAGAQGRVLAGDIVFTGVGKSAAELERAVPLGLKAINVESAGELARIEAIAGAPGRVGARRDPRQSGHRRREPSAHFDRPQDQQVRRAARRGARAVRRRSAGVRALKLVAIHVHVGSQITTLEPLRRAAAFVARLAGELRRAGRRARVRRPRRRPRHLLRRATPCRPPSEYAGALVDEVRATGLPIVVEPGRSIVGPAGVLVARVIDLKPRERVERLRRHRRRHDRADAAGALRRLPPHRAGGAARRPSRASTRSSGPSARAATSSGATACCRRSRSAIWSPFATPAPTDRRWRRTTIAGRCRRKCSSTRAGGASSGGGRPSTTCCALETVTSVNDRAASSPSKDSTRAASRPRPSCCATI